MFDMACESAGVDTGFSLQEDEIETRAGYQVIRVEGNQAQN
jgi:hypothetical protein